MRRTLAAAAAYFAIVFSLAFMLGVARTLVLAPRTGDLVAVLIETPVILAISWFACGWLTRKLSIPQDATSRLAMGAAAFALLMAAETTLSVLLFARPLAEQTAAYATPAGAAGLLAQIAFGLLPLLRDRWR